MPASSDVLVPQHYELVPADQLRPHPRNPHLSDDDAIDESVDANGFYGALVAQRSTGYVLSGHGRLRNRLRAGAPVPVVWVDVDDATALRYTLAANRAAERGSYFDDLLTARAASGSLTGTGFDDSYLDDLLLAAEQEAGDLAADEDDVAGFLARALRSIVLSYPADAFDAVNTAAQAARVARAVPTVSALFALLVAEADDAG